MAKKIIHLDDENEDWLRKKKPAKKLIKDKKKASEEELAARIVERLEKK